MQPWAVYLAGFLYLIVWAWLAYLPCRHYTPTLSEVYNPALTPLAATLMDFPASVANKRLTAGLSPLAATLTKNTGVGGLLLTRNPTKDFCPERPSGGRELSSRPTPDYKAVVTPAQTLAILKALPSPLHFTLVLTCAATALRGSEILALRWSDLLWNEGRIRISKRWAKGSDGETKTEASDGYVPLHAILTAHLRAWREQSPHAKDGDFVFPSLRARGRVPLSASIFVADHLRPAAKKAGVHIEDGQRFGLHNLRHSLSNWLVNKAKVEPKTVQGILRHAKIQTTLDLYTQEDCDETLAAQGEYLTALGVGTQMVQ